MRRSRRLLLWLSVPLVVLVGAAAVASYELIVVGDGDVHHGAEVPFDTGSTPTETVPVPTVPTTPTTTAPGRPPPARPPARPGAVWGFDPQHTRYNPEARSRPPFRRLWRIGLGDLVEFPPSVDDRGAYVETNDGRVLAIDPKTGDRLWTRHVDRPLASTPA